MKKIILLLSFFTLLSCGSDDAPAPVTNEPVAEIALTGYWKTISMTMDNQTTVYTDCNTPVNGMMPDIAVYQFTTNNMVNTWNMCVQETPEVILYSAEDNVLTMTTSAGVIMKANVTQPAANQVLLSFFWDNQEGDMTGNTILLQQTTEAEILAGLPTTNPGDFSLEGTWQLASVEYNGVAEALDNCELDTYLTFSSATFDGMEYYSYEGACEGAAISGTWSVTGDNVYTLVTPDGELTMYFVDSDTIVIWYTDTFEGISETTELTFNKQ